MDVRVRGEGNVVWTFTLPLRETYADQVKAGKLQPVDDESAEALADLIQPADDESEPETVEPSWPATHAALDELAESLGVTWPEPPEGKKSLTVAMKIEALEQAGHEPQ